MATVSLPVNHLERIERRLENLETVMGRLLDVVETKSSDSDNFQRLFTSQHFAQHLKETVALFRQDPAQFVDPFATYSPQ